MSLVPGWSLTRPSLRSGTTKGRFGVVVRRRRARGPSWPLAQFPRAPRSAKAPVPDRLGAFAERLRLRQLLQLGGDAGDVLLRLGEAGADLSTTFSGAFARNASLPSLAVALALLLLRRREVLREARSAATSIVPERSRGTSAPATGRVAVAVKESPSGWRRRSWRMAASCGASGVPSRVRRAGTRWPGWRPWSAEAADLGDDRLEGGDLLLGGLVAEAAVGRPVGDDGSTRRRSGWSRGSP